MIIGHLNINSFRNKFSLMQDIIKDFDIMLISETKLDDSFPNKQFSIPNYKLCRRDRDRFGGGLLFYINDRLPYKPILIHENKEIICLEIHQMKRKWLLIGIYNPHLREKNDFMRNITDILNRLHLQYENIILIGDFNITIEDNLLQELCTIFNLSSLIKKPTCFKSSTPSCIDLILTNQPNLFKLSNTYETGLSDFHKLVATMTRLAICKGKPKIKHYRCFKNFKLDEFQTQIQDRLQTLNDYNYDHFETEFLDTLNKLAPVKQKTHRYNDNKFMNRDLRKAIMKRSKLKSKFNKRRNRKNWQNYKKQRNICVKILKKTKKRYFQNLNVKNVTDNKRFWEYIKPYISDKGGNTNRFMLLENDKIITDDLALAQIMNNHFLNITKELNIKIHNIPKDVDLNNIFTYFENHISIQNIKTTFNITREFSFTHVNELQIRKRINSLDPKKSAISGAIPVSILKQCIDITAPHLKKAINQSFISNTFPTKMKFAETIPSFKKNDPLDKTNQRPISLLSHLSKVFERTMYEQKYSYMLPFLSKFLTGFREGHSTQHSLLIMIEKWKTALDKGQYIVAIFMDLSKAFDTINHFLLLAKLKAYGYSDNALKYMYSYLIGRKQRCQVNGKYSEWECLEVGVPQGSILGPLLFNIFINDLLLSLNYCSLSNYADDNVLYAISPSLEDAKRALHSDFEKTCIWFYENSMMLNPGKCHYMCLGRNITDDIFEYKDIKLINSTEETMLGITIDKKLTFEPHIRNICMKANQKLSALTRVSQYLSFDKKKLLYQSMIKSQFGYCPLIWMHCSRNANKTINKTQERSLRIVYNNFNLDFNELLNMNQETSIHHRNIQLLMIEIYKIVNNLSPPIMNDLLEIRENNYNLRNFREFAVSHRRTVNNGLETITYRAPYLWSTVPAEYKEAKDISEFKKLIKTWTPTHCPCRICKPYIAQIGFL